jgi:hypothetical protein
MDLALAGEVWLTDFEFAGGDGEHPIPLCMVAREWHSRREIRLWRDELLGLDAPPFPPGYCLVAFSAPAELSCYLALNWRLPPRILDLYVEARRNASGLQVTGHGLLAVLAGYGLPTLGAAYKESMQTLALRGEPFTQEERGALLDYCATDVDALDALLPRMLPGIDLPRALLRGRYQAAVARMEWTGIPIDTESLETLRVAWPHIEEELILRVDADRGIFCGCHFSQEGFSHWLFSVGIPWPRLPSGALDLADDTFREMARAYPREIGPLRELRSTLSKLRLEGLQVGSDGRNRTSLFPFGTRTGRNAPSNSKFIFGPACWLRSLILPEPGTTLAYIDWSAQEWGIAAALSGDPAMVEAYLSGDCYLAFAKQAGAVPPGGTRESYGAERERFKVLALMSNYGCGAWSLSRRLDAPVELGRQLLEIHRQTYPRYWQWSDAAEAYGMLQNRLESTFGWQVNVGPDANPRSLRNWPVQANGAEMMRLAAIFATEAGVRVCAPVHDAFLIEADGLDLEDAVAQTQDVMRRASRLVLDGFELRSEVKVLDWPNRYEDPRGRVMWELVWELVREGLRSTTHGTGAVPPVVLPSSLISPVLLG